MVRKIPFTKMVGTGNDFVVVDAATNRLSTLARRWPDLARAMCDRRYGVGADGLLVLERSRKAGARMRIFNADGSEAEMCGNGIRCVAVLAHARHVKRSSEFTIETLAGVLGVRVAGDRVAVHMTEPRDLRLDWPVVLGAEQTIRLSSVNTGVPHAVVPVADLRAVDVQGLGHRLRTHAAFGPRGANVNFVERQPKDRNRIRVRTYERGVEGETLACGTGATASAVVHAVATHHGNGSDRRTIAVDVQSGETITVSMRITPDGDGRVRVRDVVMEGPVREICQGTYVWTNGRH